MLIRLLINTVSLGGNLLMNVGPTARGYLDARAEASLRVFADWMKYNSRSIYGCTMAEPDLLPSCPNDCRFTQSEDGSRLYVHLLAYPFIHLQLPGLAGHRGLKGAGSLLKLGQVPTLVLHGGLDALGSLFQP